MRGLGSDSVTVAVLTALSISIVGCAEVPRCVSRGSGTTETVVIQCNAGKVPVCGDDPARLYDDNGALLRVPPDSVANGSCDGITGPCRPRPVCQAAGETPVCATGETPLCVLGRVTTIATRTDSGPPPDAGPGTNSDAGTDAGTDAGPDDTDAAVEADAGDAGFDAG